MLSTLIAPNLLAIGKSNAIHRLYRAPKCAQVGPSRRSRARRSACSSHQRDPPVGRQLHAWTPAIGRSHLSYADPDSAIAPASEEAFSQLRVSMVVWRPALELPAIPSPLTFCRVADWLPRENPEAGSKGSAARRCFRDPGQTRPIT